MNNFAWVTVAIGVLTGGTIMIFGFRNTDNKPLSGRISGVLKQDWTPTGNIDFRVSVLEGSFPRPLWLWVEDKRVTETAVGQHVMELRWRLATLQEGKALVTCWNARQSSPATLLPRPA